MDDEVTLELSGIKMIEINGQKCSVRKVENEDLEKNRTLNYRYGTCCQIDTSTGYCLGMIPQKNIRSKAIIHIIPKMNLSFENASLLLKFNRN